MAAALQIIFARRQLRRDRVFRDRTNPLDVYNDLEMIRRYRFHRDTIFQIEIVDRVGPILRRPTERSNAIPVNTQVLTTLRFLAKGDYQSEVADIHGISNSSVCRIVHQVCRAINVTCDNIKFPTGVEAGRVKEGFYAISSFPNVIGAIDGTLIPIQGLSGDDEPNFVCRKVYHAINVQAVTDHRLRFTDIVVRWPGSTHDAFIFSQSSLQRYMDAHPNDGWLLGDSGYPLKVWLITPLAAPNTPQEIRYQKAHCKTRNTIERSFGVLKQRFRCLHKTGGALSYKPEKSTNIIESCMRLHNLAIDQNIPLNRDGQLPVLHRNNVLNQQNLPAQAIRNQLVARF